MFKFVVLCFFVASAVAEPKPGVLLSTPYVQPYDAYSTVLSPASTSYSSQASSVILPSPITYSSALTFPHFIKKRSAQLLASPYSPYGYIPSAYSYPSAPIVSASSLATPISYGGVPVPITTHLIKKRSAQLLSTPYYAPTTYLANPAFSSPLISSPYYQTPYYSGAQLPLANAHFIKKRSAEPSAQTFLPSTYITPSTYINTIPTPYLSNPWVNDYFTAPTIPLATTHLIKKRSAEPSAEPAAEPSADPQLGLQYSSNIFIGRSPLIPTYSSTVLRAGSIYSPNPFWYSIFNKK